MVRVSSEREHRVNANFPLTVSTVRSFMEVFPGRVSTNAVRCLAAGSLLSIMRTATKAAYR